MFKKITLAAAAATALTAVPAAADAQYSRDYRSDQYARDYRSGQYDRSYSNNQYPSRYEQGGYYGNSHDDGYYGRTDAQYRRCSGTTGTILGAAAGALAGRAIDRNNCRR